VDEPADLTDPQIWLEVAEMKLEHARRIFEIGLYDDALSRSYYAMYYAAKAALLTEGVDLRRHSGAITKFRELFVITGKIEAIYLRYLGRAQSACERSDYVPIIPSSREDALEILSAAEQFISKMKDVIESVGEQASGL
jgi:uncharacterized protein (UPF0332 family)